MEWIFDNFQIVAIVALVLGSLVKQFLEAKAEERRARERNEQEPAEEEIFGPDEDWEESRPSPASPPPLVRPGPPPLFRPPPVPQFQPPPPEAEEALKRQLDMQERLRQIREEKAARAKQAASPAAASKSRTGSAAAATTIRGALSRPGDARRAIVLREILGPPVGLR
jgi:type IV secretory pathway VirB10-like protein